MRNIQATCAAKKQMAVAAAGDLNGHGTTCESGPLLGRIQLIVTVLSTARPIQLLGHIVAARRRLGGRDVFCVPQLSCMALAAMPSATLETAAQQ